MYIEIKAPAKINIGLNILSKRVDGFHNLSTLFYPINDLYDVLTFSSSTKFHFQCNSESIPNDENNLVVKAKNILEHFSKTTLNVCITLDKIIPSQAGLGGGSSDAAATLISLNEMFELKIEYTKLIQLASELGSDVPFFIKAKPAIGTSRGEILDDVDLEIQTPIVIINPGINISTKEAFNNVAVGEIDSDYKSLLNNGKLNYGLAVKNIKNDFEQYVFATYPEIKIIKDLLYEEGALFALMSGTGSSVYGIFSTSYQAEVAIKNIPRKYFCFLSNPTD